MKGGQCSVGQALVEKHFYFGHVPGRRPGSASCGLRCSLGAAHASSGRGARPRPYVAPPGASCGRAGKNDNSESLSDQLKKISKSFIASHYYSMWSVAYPELPRGQATWFTTLTCVNSNIRRRYYMEISLENQQFRHMQNKYLIDFYYFSICSSNFELSTGADEPLFQIIF